MRASRASENVATQQDVADLEQRVDSKFDLLRKDLAAMEARSNARHELLCKDMDGKYASLSKDMDTKYVSLSKDMDAKLEKLKLNLIIWLGSIVFLIVNAGPVLPKLLQFVS